MQVALTIDNGPDQRVTPRVLDVLEARGIRATFFVVGERLRIPEQRALARAARSAGHRIGNHTYSHGTPFGLLENPETAVGEIARTAELIAELAGEEPLFRPSAQGGPIDARIFNAPAIDYLLEHRYTCVLWNNLPRDWEDHAGWPERALAACRAQSEETNVVVLHDFVPEAMAGLERFLDTLLSMGATFVQTFPDSCVPIRAGRTTPLLDEIMARRPV